MFNCTGMLFFPLPLRLYLGLKTLGLIPVQNSICPLSQTSTHPNLPCSTGFHRLKMGGAVFDPKGSVLSQHLDRDLSPQDQDPWPRWSFPRRPTEGSFPSATAGKACARLGKQNICFGNLLALNLWSLLSKRPWKPFASQQLQAVVLCLCEVTNSTAILCVGSVFI